MGLAAYVLGVLGLGCLALSLQKHWHAAFARKHTAPTKWILRAVGLGLLAVLFVCCLAWWGTAIGVVAGLGTLSVSAVSVAMLLAYGRRLLPRQHID